MTDLPTCLTLADLDLDVDPGRDWHPRHRSAYSVNGDLLDLAAPQVAEHQAKPEAAHAEGILAAEDSHETPEGVV